MDYWSWTKRWFLLLTELILVLSALLKQYFPSDSTEKVIKTNTSVKAIKGIKNFFFQ